MKVSAIIVTFNRRKFIRRAIESILAQTVPVDELIVVDDGSTDGTAAAIEEWFGARVKLVRQQNAGVGLARHRGIQEAKGEWVAFLDSDDEWVPERTRQLLEAAECVPSDVAWIFGDLQVVTDAGHDKTLFQEHGLEVKACPEVFSDSLTVQFPFQFGLLQGSLIRRSVLVQLNCFHEGLRSDDDLLAGFQVACRHKVAAIPFVVGKYFRTSDLSASSVVVNGVYRPDHFRSRMMAFACVIESGRKQPWNSRYASEVRGLCKVLAVRGPVPRSLVLNQFKYGGYSAKGLAFACAGMLGRRGLQLWNGGADYLQARRLASSERGTSTRQLPPHVASVAKQR